MKITSTVSVKLLEGEDQEPFVEDVVITRDEIENMIYQHIVTQFGLPGKFAEYEIETIELHPENTERRNPDEGR